MSRRVVLSVVVGEAGVVSDTGSAMDVPTVRGPLLPTTVVVPPVVVPPDVVPPVIVPVDVVPL